MKIIKISLLSTMLFLACNGVTIYPPGPAPQPDDVDTSECHVACENLRRLGCDDANPVVTQYLCVDDEQCVDRGLTCSLGTCVASCEKFCNDTVSLGVGLNPSCVASVLSCDKVQQCQ